MTGTLYGVGLGPGDPELLTLKAARIIQSADVVVFFSKAGKRGHAHRIVADLLPPQQHEIALVYPVTTEVAVTDPRYSTQLHAFYEESAQQLRTHLQQGKSVAVLCVGDPFFYGSFMHLYHRLVEEFNTQVVPGITAMSGCWSNAHLPMTWGDDVLTVLPGTLPTAELTQYLTTTNAAVIMKLGQNFARVRAAIAATGLLERAIYAEYGTMHNQHIMPLRDKIDTPAPYFSLILIAGQGRQL